MTSDSERSFHSRAFLEASRRRILGLVYMEGDAPSVGTGTLLEHGDELFVVTCGHVARGFVKSDGVPRIVTQDPSRELMSADLELSHCSSSDPDLALLAVARNRRDRLAGTVPITLADVDSSFDFVAATTPPVRTDFALCGFPARLAGLVGPDLLRLVPLCFTTAPAEQRPSSKSSLVLDYPTRGVHGELPDAPGLSGALIYIMERPRDGDLWSVGRAVAIQHSWHERERFVRCDPLTLLHRWLAR